MHGTRLQTLRFAFHLDRIPVRDPRAGKRSVQPFRRRTRHSAAQPHAHQSSRPRLHSPPRLPRRNRRLRRSIEGRPQLPQPQSISRRHPRRSRRALHTRHRRHLRSHPHRLLPSHPLRRPPPPRRRLHQAPPRHLTPPPPPPVLPSPPPSFHPPRRLIPPPPSPVLRSLPHFEQGEKSLFSFFLQFLIFNCPNRRTAPSC